MKNYIYTTGSHLLATEGDTLLNAKFDKIAHQYLNVDWMWLIEEDGTFIYYDKQYDVKAGDLVFVMYGTDYDSTDTRKVIVVKNEDLFNHYLQLREREKRQELEHKTKCCSGCDSCPKSSVSTDEVAGPSPVETETSNG